MPFFTQRFNKEKNIRNNFAHQITFGRWASFIQGAAIRYNPLFTFEKEFFNTYWRDFDNVIGYFLLDFMMALAYDNIAAVRKEFDAVPLNNLDVFNLFEHLYDRYEAYPFDKILTNNFLHKLTYKIPLNMTRPDTVFREIQRRYAPETIQK